MARFDDDDEEDEFGDSNQLPSARPAEDLLIRVSHKFAGEKILCTTLGRGQLAGLLANLDSRRQVTCCFGDLFAAQISRKFFGEISRNIQVVCDPEFPGEDYDLIAIPVGKHGEAELMRDYLQSAVLKLKVGGQLWTAVDNEEDRWLIQEMKKLFKKVTVEEIPGGIVYHAVREEKPPRIRDFSADFAIRDGERLQKFISRPGVFNHRQVDLGARALI
jgi:16S rRNA (guanine1207-N2)-methyltransferase